MSGAVPPQNLDAEENVLGAMMLSRHAITAVSDIIRPDDFYRAKHGRIFQAALDLDARGEPVDAITLSEELSRRGALEQVGGRVALAQLAAIVPSTANAGHYAKIVRDTATRRALVSAGNTISKLGWDGHGEAGDLLANAEAALSGVSDGASSGDSFTPLSEDVATFAGEIIAAAEAGTELFGLKTGLPSLDAITTGLHPGELTVIAARPSMGKSVLGQTIAINVVERDIPAAFLSLEMSGKELATRWLAKLTHIDTNQLRRAQLDAEERQKVASAVTQISKSPLFAEDNAALTMPEIRARVRRLKRRNPKLGLLVVDYLQLMVAGGDPESRQQEVASLSRNLKLLAKELHIPVIAISQLNRGVEARDNKRPRLSDLRDSGAIEQDADIILFLYREAAYKQVAAENENDTELIVAKNRMGEAHKTINLIFLKRRQMLTEPARSMNP